MKKCFRLLVAAVLLVGTLPLGMLPVSAEESYLRYGDVKRILLKSENSVADTYTSTEGQSLPYRLYVPDDYTPEKHYPLVIFFHGAGERGTDNNHLFLGGSIFQRLLMPSEREKHPCLILAPQCPTDSQWVLSDWGPGTYDHTQIQKSPYMTAAEELIDQVIADYAVDENALYVSGLSMGGYGTWDLISRHPDKYAAAIPICGGIDAAYMNGLKGFPIRTFHASDDPVVNCVGTRKAAEMLKDHGDFAYTEFETGGHLIWDTAYATPDLMDWLFAQRIGASPEIDPDTMPETDAETVPETETVPDTHPNTFETAGHSSAATENTIDTANTTNNAAAGGCASACGAPLAGAVAVGVACHRKKNDSDD